MLPHICPILEPKINFDNFVEAANAALGYNIYHGYENRNLNDFATFLGCLSAFHSREYTKKPVQAIKDSHFEHLQFGFLVVCSKSTIIKSLERTILKHTIVEDQIERQLAVISGTLKEFKSAIIECTQDDGNLRILYDKIYLYFEEIGLSYIFNDTRKIKFANKTFRIEDKR